MATFECNRCGAEKPVQTDGGTGYGIDRLGQKVCYLCCAADDRLSMQVSGLATLYLTSEAKPDFSGVAKWRISNWPETLEFVPLHVKKSGHNMTDRYDVWFVFEGRVWHGVNLGNSDILHCKRTLKVAA